MPQVFISYSRVDTTFVEHLISRVQLAFPDLKIWQDKAPHGLIGGDNWWEAILKAVAESDVFIYVLSNESVQSAYCQAEFTEARRLQKRIITIQARDKTELTDELDDIQFVDMKHGVDDPEALQRLNAALNKQLAQAKKQRPLWKPATPKPSKEPPPTRTAASPDITTPVLIRPPAEDEALRIARSGLRWQIASVVIAVIFGLIALIPLLNPENGGGRGATTPTNQPTDLLDAETTISQTVTVTLLTSIPMPSTTVSMASTNIPLPPVTLADPSTQVWLDFTRTAESFTSTPTPNATQTYRAVLQIAGLTLTAQLPGFTPITRNADWTPITQDFDGVTMVRVPAGCFDMGSEDGGDDEMPVHEQCFDVPFWLDQTEVTQADFERLGGQKATPNSFDGDQRPVENITWFEARDFCTLRGLRLPTEREWEYAVRGPDNRIYPWGNEWNPENAVHSGNSNNQTASVGSRPVGVSWIGAQDLSGNVWEWVSSLYQDYPYVMDDGREDDDNRTIARILRGGSWLNASSNLRAPNRIRDVPDDGDYYIGFRCARSS